MQTSELHDVAGALRTARENAVPVAASSSTCPAGEPDGMRRARRCRRCRPKAHPTRRQAKAVHRSRISPSGSRATRAADTAAH